MLLLLDRLVDDPWNFRKMGDEGPQSVVPWMRAMGVVGAKQTSWLSATRRCCFLGDLLDDDDLCTADELLNQKR